MEIFWIIAIIGAVIFIFLISIFSSLGYRQYRKIVSYKGRLLSNVNIVRKKRGLLPLGRVKFLDYVASKHARSMAKRRSCDHLGFAARAKLIVDKMGLGYVAENCYKFPGTRYTRRKAQGLLKGWMQSPGHRANIMNANMRRTGIGIRVSRGYIYAVQIFTN